MNVKLLLVVYTGRTTKVAVMAMAEHANPTSVEQATL